MTNIFKNATFGDSCICKNGKKMIFLYLDEHFEAKLIGLFTGDDGDYIGAHSYDLDGTCRTTGGTCRTTGTDYDIVYISKQKDEESVDSHIRALVDAGYHGDLHRYISGSSDKFERTETISL